MSLRDAPASSRVRISTSRMAAKAAKFSTASGNLRPERPTQGQGGPLQDANAPGAQRICLASRARTSVTSTEGTSCAGNHASRRHRRKASRPLAIGTGVPTCRRTQPPRQTAPINPAHSHPVATAAASISTVEPWVMITIAESARARPTFQAPAWWRGGCYGRSSESTPAGPPDPRRRPGVDAGFRGERGRDWLVKRLSESGEADCRGLSLRPPNPKIPGPPGQAAGLRVLERSREIKIPHAPGWNEQEWCGHERVGVQRRGSELLVDTDTRGS